METQQKEITIYVNNKPVAFSQSEVTGSEIKAKAGVPADSILYKLQGDKRIPVGDSDRIKIHEDERFLDVPGGNVS